MALRVVVLLVVLLAGTVTVRAATRDTQCLPGIPQAAPDSAAPGDGVVVTASAFPCDRRYHAGALYGLRFRHGGGDEVDLGSFPVARDGTFRAEVSVPESATPGTGTFFVTGYDIRDVVADVCDDGGAGCTPYAARITVVP